MPKMGIADDPLRDWNGLRVFGFRHGRGIRGVSTSSYRRAIRHKQSKTAFDFNTQKDPIGDTCRTAEILKASRYEDHSTFVDDQKPGIHQGVSGRSESVSERHAQVMGVERPVGPQQVSSGEVHAYAEAGEERSSLDRHCHEA